MGHGSRLGEEFANFEIARFHESLHKTCKLLSEPLQNQRRWRGARGLSPQKCRIASLPVKHTGQESGGELC